MSKFIKSKSSIYVAYCLSIFLVTLLGAYGLADGYAPQWKASFFTYLPAHLIWIVYDLLKPVLFDISKTPNVFSRDALKRFSLFLIVALTGVILSIFLVYGTGLNKTDSSKNYQRDNGLSAISGLSETVAEINKNMPVKVNDEITISKVGLEGSKTIVYTFQVSDSFYSSPEVKEDIELNGITKMVEYYCLGSAEDLRNLGVVVINRYVNKEGNFLNQTALDTKNCTQEYLNLIIKQTKPLLPVKQDEVTNLINLEFLAQRDLVYTFSVPSEFYNEQGVKENIALNIPKNMRQNICFGDGKDFRKVDAKIIYRYVDEANAPLVEFVLDTATCGVQ